MKKATGFNPENTVSIVSLSTLILYTINLNVADDGFPDDVGCHMDRHENIGKGKIGLAGFRHVMKDKRLNNIPMILETPPVIDDRDEIKLLYSLWTELRFLLQKSAIELSIQYCCVNCKTKQYLH